MGCGTVGKAQREKAYKDLRAGRKADVDGSLFSFFPFSSFFFPFRIATQSFIKIRITRRKISTTLSAAMLRGELNLLAWKFRDFILTLRACTPTCVAFLRFALHPCSVIVNLSFGHRFPRAAGDELLEGIYEAMENVAKVSQPGTYLVDSFPFLQKITPPFLRTWDREGERMHEEEWKVWGGHLYRLKDEYKAGTAKECFIGELLAEREGMSQAEQEEKALTDYDLGYQICGFLEAGSDTTASALASCVLALIQFPDVLRRAHEELDRVVGQDRMPTWEDEPKLQYIRGIAKEVS